MDISSATERFKFSVITIVVTIEESIDRALDDCRAKFDFRGIREMFHRICVKRAVYILLPLCLPFLFPFLPLPSRGV